MLETILDRFARASSISVMARASLERAVSSQVIDDLFEKAANRQYVKELLFSTAASLLTTVVVRTNRSVHDAARNSEELNVSVTALYEKLKHTETGVSEALVRQTAANLAEIIDHMQGAIARPESLKGALAQYPVSIVDGNHPSGTEHRPKVLRGTRAAALPGQTICVYDMDRGLISRLVCCEDAHAQERSLTPQILGLVQSGHLYIDDRNFCTTKLLCGIHNRDAFFITRRHRSTLHVVAEGAPKKAGRCGSGTLTENWIDIEDEDGKVLRLRQITLTLAKPTTGGETIIRLLTNLPKEVKARQIAEAYKERWTIERAFNDLTVALRCEIETLAYPKAAMLSFAVACMTYNVVQLCKAAIRARHGAKVADSISTYYLGGELDRTMSGMAIAVPDEAWEPYVRMPVAAFAAQLLEWAGQLRLKSLTKSPRGPKKPPPKRTFAGKHHHVSTKRLLDAAKVAKAKTP